MVFKEESKRDACPERPARSGSRKTCETTWWGDAWRRSVESASGEKTSSAASLLAAEGRIYGIGLSKGSVRAKAEGPHSEEYRVKIRFDRLRGVERRALLSYVSDPYASLALLSNELPENCGRRIFKPLFGGFRPECTCSDGGTFCAHAAAVCLILSHEIDKAPQILFFLRGVRGEELLSHIRGRGGKA